MNLNKQSKEILRKSVEEQLANVPEGKKIHLDTNILEELLFDIIEPKNGNGPIAKLPVWSGTFLRKIDLRMMSFENVAWSILNHKDGPNYNMPWNNVVVDENYGIIAEDNTFRYNVLEDDKKIDYSYTNANIDFTKSWEAKITGKSSFYLCDFSGVNFYDNNIDDVSLIMDCDFSNTGIKITSEQLYHPYNKEDMTNHLRILRTSFSGNNLSPVQINVDYSFLSSGIDLSGTEAHINYDLDNLVNDKNVFWTSDDLQQRKELISKQINEIIKSGYWDGCYLNGKLHFSEDDKKGVYSQYTQDILSSVTNSIDAQISNMKK